MSKERKTQLVTIAALLSIVAIGLGWKLGHISPKEPPAPQDTIYAMLEAARSGNVAKYLASYTGALEESLRESVRESGESAFAKYLPASNASIKGVTVGEPQPVSDTETSVRVEYVYQDRNEAQIMHLERIAGEWKIARVDGADRVKTLVPYGTPVK